MLTQLLQEGSATSAREERPNFDLDNIHHTPSFLDKSTATAPCTTTANTEPNKQDTISTSTSSNNTNKIIYNISKDTDVLCLSLLPSPPSAPAQQPSSPPLTARSSTTTVEAESNKSNYNYNNNSNNMYINSNNEKNGHNSDRDQVIDNNSANRRVIAVASMRSVFFNQGNTLHYISFLLNLIYLCKLYT